MRIIIIICFVARVWPQFDRNLSLQATFC